MDEVQSIDTRERGQPNNWANCGHQITWDAKTLSHLTLGRGWGMGHRFQGTFRAPVAVFQLKWVLVAHLFADQFHTGGKMKGKVSSGQQWHI